MCCKAEVNLYAERNVFVTKTAMLRPISGTLYRGLRNMRRDYLSCTI